MEIVNAESDVSSSDSDDVSSSDSDPELATTTSVAGQAEESTYSRKKRRQSRYTSYIQGTARKVYKKSMDLSKSLESLPPIDSVCLSCASGLNSVIDSFFTLKQQGSTLKKRKNRLPNPKRKDFEHYRNLNAQNEWLRVNIFDAMGNYLFCHKCVVKTLKISSQRLTRQRKVKRKSVQNPIMQYSKKEVSDKKLTAFVVMPEGVDTAFTKWWITLPDEHAIDIRVPYESHGLSGRLSNNSKVEAKQAFLAFVDANSTPNGRRLDSRNPTHYLLPRFKTISTPKRSVLNYEEKVKLSLTVEFNRLQTEEGKATISDFSATTWLKQERPKVAIYPHQKDYCDFCAKVKKELQGHQQKLNRLKQTGSTSAEELQAAEAEKEKTESLLSDHRKEARESLKNYNELIDKCAQEWKEIQDLQSSPDNSGRLNELQQKFTLVLSADYQMNKLLPYWGLTPQPGSTYYMQKVSYDLLGIVDHRDDSGFVYMLNELIGHKNTDHTISYLLHYLKSSGKVPGWIKRVHVFMDNAGSTNKNKFMMAALYEVVSFGVLNYFRASFMIAGHTKFAPDRMFALIARTFYSSDVFMEKEICDIVRQHAGVIIDGGQIVRTWRELLGEKYTNLPGIRELHDFVAELGPTRNAFMKVRKMCYSGTFSDTPMKIIDATQTAIPTISHTYNAKKLIKELSKVKETDMKQMYTNFIQRERWHELLL